MLLSCKNGGLSDAGITNLEDSGGVIVDGVDTGAILPEEEHATQEKTVHDTLVGTSGLEWLPEANTNGCALLLQGGVNSTNLLNHVDIILGQLTDPAKVLNSILTTAAGEQPTGRLADEDTTNQQEAGRDQLDSEGDQPLLVAGSQSLGDTILKANRLAHRETVFLFLSLCQDSR